MFNSTFPTVLTWTTQHGYPLIFLVMVAEGHVIISAMSFAVTFGYFNLWIIFLLGFMGDIVGDFLWYGIGYFGGKPMVKKFGHIFRVSEERMERLRLFLERHPGKALAVIKFSPFIPAPGLILVGFSRMNVKKFFSTISAIIIPKTIFFMALGYFFGNAFTALYRYIKNGLYAAAIILVLAWVVFHIYKQFGTKVSEQIEGKE